MAASSSGDSQSFDESFEGLQPQLPQLISLTSLDTLLQKVYERQEQSSGAIAARIASLERQICRLQVQYEVAGAKMQSKVKRKRFLTSCSTTPNTKKKQKVQDVLSPRPCIDDTARRNLDCDFFHVGDEENVDDQQDGDKVCQPLTSSDQDAWSIDDWSGFEPVPAAQTELEGPHGCHEHHEPVEQPASAIHLAVDDCFYPAMLVLPNLLECFCVPEILSWRATSTHTRRPKILLQHVNEMGSMSRRSSVVQYAHIVSDLRAVMQKESLLLGRSRVVKWFVQTRFGDDAALGKVFFCQLWCLQQGSLFREADVRETLPVVIQDLSEHCGSQDQEVCSAGFSAIETCLCGSRQHVQVAVASSLYTLLQRPNWETTWLHTQNILNQFRACFRVLSRAERQKWMMTLVCVTPREFDAQRRLFVLGHAELLWAVDPSPRETYDNVCSMLRIMESSKDVGAAVRRMWMCV
ncbi:unnamed protein product [Symbiodinium sp. CCMP2592]|nr:unnamed protein product [Symbiodinium sp. CCMP2592]